MNRYLQLLEDGNWTELVSDLMVNYYDPLYRHTLPERRIEIDLEPEATAMERIEAVVAELIKQSSESN